MRMDGAALGSARRGDAPSMPYVICARCGLTTYSAALWSGGEECPRCGARIPVRRRRDGSDGGPHSMIVHRERVVHDRGTSASADAGATIHGAADEHHTASGSA